MPWTRVQSEMKYGTCSDNSSVQTCQNLPRTAFKDHTRVAGDQCFDKRFPAYRMCQFSHQAGPNLVRSLKWLTGTTADEPNRRSADRNLLKSSLQRRLSRLHHSAVVRHWHANRSAGISTRLQLFTQLIQIRNTSGNDCLIGSVITCDVTRQLQLLNQRRDSCRFRCRGQHRSIRHSCSFDRICSVNRRLQSSIQVPGTGRNQCGEFAIAVSCNKIRPNTSFRQRSPGSQIRQQDRQLCVEYVVAKISSCVLCQKFE